MTEAFPGWDAPENEVRHWLCKTLQPLVDNGYNQCQDFLRKSNFEAASGSSSLLAKPAEFFPAYKPRSLLEVIMLALFGISVSINLLIVYLVYRWFRDRCKNHHSSMWLLSSTRLPPVIYSSTTMEVQHNSTVPAPDSASDGFNDAVSYQLLPEDLPPSYVQVMKDAEFQEPNNNVYNTS